MRRTVLLSHSKELIFHSLSQVVENPMFFDWNDEFAIDYKDLTISEADVVGRGTSGVIYKGS
jgi:hypothetical protein